MPGTKRAHAALELIHASMSAIRQPTRPGDSNPGRGCLIAAVGSDIGRQPRTVRRAFTKGLKSLIEGLGNFMPRRSPAARLVVTCYRVPDSNLCTNNNASSWIGNGPFDRVTCNRLGEY